MVRVGFPPHIVISISCRPWPIEGSEGPIEGSEGGEGNRLPKAQAKKQSQAQDRRVRN